MALYGAKIGQKSISLLVFLNSCSGSGLSLLLRMFWIKALIKANIVLMKIL